MNFIVIIPAHYASTRLKGKPLLDINGKPMILHVMKNAYESGANKVIIATDHKEIAHVVKLAGGEVCITRSDHQSGIERIAEVVKKYDFKENEIVVNIQSDEPSIPAIFIRKVADDLNDLINRQINMTTLAVPIRNIKEMYNTNIVKVVLNTENCALYFSRSNIPFWKDKNQFDIYDNGNNSIFLRHLGVYSYYVKLIHQYVNWQPSPIEKIETLEQLRILWYGEKIYVSIIYDELGPSVNTLNDLEYTRTILK